MRNTCPRAHASSRAKIKRNFSLGASCEALEARIAPATLVTFDSVAGQLRVQGDFQDDGSQTLQAGAIENLQFSVSALGQVASGTIDVAQDYVRLEVTLPWLLAVLAEKITPAIRKEGTLLLDKK